MRIKGLSNKLGLTRSHSKQAVWRVVDPPKTILFRSSRRLRRRLERKKD
jgi:hypothetical protein